jgi:hypothetical protein
MILSINIIVNSRNLMIFDLDKPGKSQYTCIQYIPKVINILFLFVGEQRQHVFRRQFYPFQKGYLCYLRFVVRLFFIS